MTSEQEESAIKLSWGDEPEDENPEEPGKLPEGWQSSSPQPKEEEKPAQPPSLAPWATKPIPAQTQQAAHEDAREFPSLSEEAQKAAAAAAAAADKPAEEKPKEQPRERPHEREREPYPRRERERGYDRGYGDRDRDHDRYSPRGGERFPTKSPREREREQREWNERPQNPIPDQPPYEAFVGNLAFEVTEREVSEYFEKMGNCQVVLVRLNRERDGRLKGYGHVKFEDRKSLEEALKLNGYDFMKRKLRVDVASQSQPRERFTDRRGNSPRNEREGGVQQQQQHERPKLELKPRSVDLPVGGIAENSKRNPFGAAKPRDQMEIERKKEMERQEREKAEKEKQQKEKEQQQQQQQQQTEEKEKEKPKEKQQEQVSTPALTVTTNTTTTNISAAAATTTTKPKEKKPQQPKSGRDPKNPWGTKPKPKEEKKSSSSSANKNPFDMLGDA